jgi:hypothetical protein
VERSATDDDSAQAPAARVDTLRAKAVADDPEASNLYGFEVSEPVGEADKAQAGDNARSKIGEGVGDDSTEKLEAELEKVLQHPQVIQAIEERIGEAERARQSYLDGLAAATQIAQASFLAQFPEFARMAPEKIPGALELMSRQDPAKLARIQATVAAAEQLFAGQQQESRRQANIARHNFLELARAEDARLETMLKGEPKETQQAVMMEIMASAWESGIEPTELTRLFNSEPLMRNATFQRMMKHCGHALQLRNGWCCIVSDTTDNIPSANNFIRAGYRLYRPEVPWGWPHTLYWRKPIQSKERR